VFFWAWWLQPGHTTDVWCLLANSVLTLYITVFPGLFFWWVSQMKRPNPSFPIPDSLRVAMVVTKTPSEPVSPVKVTLQGMLAQEYPHDVWLAGEDSDPDTVFWCRLNGVRRSTRNGVDAYHQPSWPRRAGSQEGNLSYFYDHQGYDNYDIVVPPDADHKPAPGYLEEMLRPFADPEVGFVSAPSICDASLGDSWAVRGRLHAEGGFHGAAQAAHNTGRMPLCIGSHYAVRTRAQREIRGLGPESAEDHSTTLLMHAGGWTGAHALDAEAHGDGPVSFADGMA
jgi:cellulose synthase (UDP-forming)